MVRKCNRDPHNSDRCKEVGGGDCSSSFLGAGGDCPKPLLAGAGGDCPTPFTGTGGDCLAPIKVSERDCPSSPSVFLAAGEACTPSFRGAGGDCPSFSKRAEADIKTRPTESQPVKTLLDYESHFKWIQSYSLSEQQLLRIREDIKDWTEDTEDTKILMCHTISKYLSQLVFDVILGNDAGYKEAVSKLENELDNFAEDFPKGQATAYRYLVLIEKANALHRIGDELESNNLLEKAAAIDISDDKTKAAILIVKAILLGLLSDNEERLNLLHTVIELDSETADWYQCLYSTLRRVRRERDFTSTPLEEEIHACRMSYDLNRESPAALCKMAVLYNDTLKAYRFGHTNSLLIEHGFEDMSKEMIWFARRAGDLNPECVDTNVKLAEMLAKGVYCDVKASREQFDRCLRDWPNNSEVLHKVGKFAIAVERNRIAGLSYYKQAMEADDGNYPCLMDYLRETFRQNNEDCSLKVELLEDLVKIVELHLPAFELNKVLSGRLKCCKAALLWKLGDEDEAIDLWLASLLRDPKLIKDGVMCVMSAWTLFERMIQTADFHKMLAKLKEKGQNELIDDKKTVALESLIKTLEEEIADWILFQQGKANNPNWRKGVSKSNFKKHGGQDFKRQMRYLAECDIEPDWRSQCAASGRDTSTSASVWSDNSSMISEPNFNTSYPSNSLGDKQWQIPQKRYNAGVGYSSTIGSRNTYDSKKWTTGCAFAKSDLERSRERFGSTMSVCSVGSEFSTATMGSSFSRNYGFPRPYNRNQYVSASDADDNWRRK